MGRAALWGRAWERGRTFAGFLAAGFLAAGFLAATILMSFEVF